MEQANQAAGRNQMNQEAAQPRQGQQERRGQDQRTVYDSGGSPRENGAADQNGQGRQLSAADAGSRTNRAQASTTIVPPVDIFEDDAGFTVIADMPGVSKEQLGVRVNGDSLVIEGTASVPVTGDMELLYGEVSNPQYRRSFTLSRELDPGKIEAKLNNGVLRLTIPKAEEARPRRINVSVG